MTNYAPIIAGLLFGIMALLHLGRLLCDFEVDIAGQSIPFWASGVFFVCGGLLSAWLFRAQRIV
jgi:hypothetical protein